MRSRQEYEALLSNPNVQRGLAVIRATEGTARYANPYSTAFGGRQFNNNGQHPNKLYGFKTKSGKRQKTSAAGAYQFLGRTWKNVAGRLGLNNMSKENQDIAALALIDGRGGLNALVEGDMKTFVEKAGPEWASLPTAPKSYDQPTKGWSFVEQAWDSAIPEPVERTQLADLPLPTDRPEDGLLASLPVPEPAPERSFLSAFNPISTAAASEMPPAGLLQPAPRPELSSMLDTTPSRPLPEGVAPSDLEQRGPDTFRPTSDLDRFEQPLSQPAPSFEPTFSSPPPAEPTSMLDQKGMLPAPSSPLEQYAQEFDAGIAANPESMLPEELVMSQPVNPASMLPPPTPAPPAPVTTPVQAPSMLPAPQDPYTLQQSYTPPPAPPPPSAMDVWNGKESYGVDNTGQYELNRADNGNIYRYSSKYDRTDILNPDGSYRGQKSGKIEGPADSSINLPSFGNPFGKASTKSGAMVRGVLGSTLGGALGGTAGPVGSLAGSLVGRNLAQGQGLLSLQGAASKMTPGHYGPITANTFPDAPNSAGFLSSRRSRNNSSLYDPNAGGLSAAEEAARRNSISPAAAAHVARGGGALF